MMRSKILRNALYLIPVNIGDDPPSMTLPAGNMEIINEIDEFIVENAKTARHFLKAAGYGRSFNEVVFHILDKHTLPEDLPGFINSLKNGKPVGLLSEAGMPCIADPGSEIVRLCHENNIPIVPLTGPSSIFLALAGSGFNGQQFVFHGYLPVEKHARVRRIKELERNIYRDHYTQILHETPYRNNQMLDTLLKTCLPGTLLCIAANLTSPGGYIVSKTIAEWKSVKIDLNNKPVVFLLYG